MLLQPKTISKLSNRTFKNFGHKHQPIPVMTTLWHGFLTFGFVGMGLNWDRFSTFMFGDLGRPEIDWDTSPEET